MRRLFLVSSLVVSLAVAVPARGGDEVDYSAPYLVVENGELVTKYPNREHETVAEEAGAGDAADASAPGAADEINGGGIFAAALAAVIIGILLLVRRARRRSSRHTSTAG
jgi:hypothetical protein